MSRRVFLILLVMTLSSVSCTYREFKVVESVMETDPLLADSLLNGIRVSDSGRSLFTGRNDRFCRILFAESKRMGRFHCVNLRF